MGIYDCADTLGEALDSLLAQTYQDFRVVMCDDGSHDDTALVAQGYVDHYPGRFTLLRNDANRGLSFTLNRCIEEVDTEFAARMDGDDISLPERLERQVEYLDEHPEAAWVSTPMKYFDATGVWADRTGMEPERPEARDFMGHTPYCHAPAMLRTEAYRRVVGYDPEALRIEDYDLWSRLHAIGLRGHNMKEALYMMRDDHLALRRRTRRSMLINMRYTLRVVKRLGLPFYYRVYALRPLAAMLAPRWLHRRVHRAVVNAPLR